jgi:hypothetical protein
MQFTVKIGATSVTAAPGPEDYSVQVGIDLDGRPLAGLELRHDGSVTLGYWPDGEEWATTGTVRPYAAALLPTAPALHQQTAAALFGQFISDAEEWHPGTAAHVAEMPDREAMNYLISKGPLNADDSKILANALRLLDPARFGLAEEGASDFFQPGRTYQRGRWLFACLAVAPRPWDGEVRAVGYLYRPADGTGTTESLSPHSWEHDGWTEVATDENTPTADHTRGETR